jgi:hypothetical protein
MSQFPPALAKHFAVPRNWEDDPEGQARFHYIADRCSPELLAAFASVQCIDPAVPSGQSLNTLRDIYRRILNKPPFPELVWLACWGYLPRLGTNQFGHPWIEHGEAVRLILDVADPAMMGAFVLWQLSVVRDADIDRKTKVLRARNKRVELP